MFILPPPAQVRVINVKALMFDSLLTLGFPFVVVFMQVAIIAGNFDLAEIIKIHKVSDVGKSTAALSMNGCIYLHDNRGSGADH